MFLVVFRVSPVGIPRRRAFINEDRVGKMENFRLSGGFLFFSWLFPSFLSSFFCLGLGRKGTVNGGKQGGLWGVLGGARATVYCMVNRYPSTLEHLRIFWQAEKSCFSSSLGDYMETTCENGWSCKTRYMETLVSSSNMAMFRVDFPKRHVPQLPFQRRCLME